MSVTRVKVSEVSLPSSEVTVYSMTRTVIPGMSPPEAPLRRRRRDAAGSAIIAALGSLLDVIRDAGPAEKAAIYDQLSLKVTFKPGEAKIRAEVTIGPENYLEHAQQCGDTGRVRGGTDPVSPHCSISYGADIDL